MNSTELSHKEQQMILGNSTQKAKKMSIDQIQKKQNRSQSIENILSSSIARAKQKIQMMQQKKNPRDFRDSLTSNRSVQKKQNKDSSNVNNLKPNTQLSNQQVQTARSKQPSSKTDASNTAVVNVVKNLQAKITELQKLNESIQRQKRIMTKQLNNVSEEKRMLLESMQEVKKRNLHLQQTIIKANKQEIKQLQQKNQNLENQNLDLKNKVKELELKLKQQHLSHLSIQKNNEKKLKEKKQDEKVIAKNEQLYQTYTSKLKETQQHQRNLIIKQKDLLERQTKLGLKWNEIFNKQEDLIKRQKNIQEKQNKNYEQLSRYNQTMALANEVRKELEDKNIQLKKQLQQQKKMVKQLQLIIDEQRKLKQELQLNIDTKYRTKINELQEQIQNFKETYKHSSKKNLYSLNKNQKIDSLKDQLVDLTQQYQQLFTRYKKAQQKFQKQQKQAKNYRTKFWKLKDIISEISQKVNKMPNAIHSQLKLLIVKANKLQSFQIQKSSLSNIYGTPNKKNRSSSIQNKSLSKLTKSKSKSKTKNTINLTYLDSSRKSNTSAKSKRSQKSQRSLSKKKQVILSTTNRNATNQTDIKICSLEKQIKDLKNNYKKLVEIMNEKNDQQTRNQLNDLVFQLQQKSQELTKLKNQKRKKF